MATVPVPTAVQPPREVKLAKECELRVEVGPDTPLLGRLLAGTAEIYGSELPRDICLPVSPRSKIATPMMSYVNVHAILDARRSRAKASQSTLLTLQGPRVIVVGPTDSGKSTLCRMLLSWAAKWGWKPTYVDLDIGQGSNSLSASIGATPVEIPIDPVEGNPLEMPMVYFYGHTTPSIGRNGDLLEGELIELLDVTFSYGGNALPGPTKSTQRYHHTCNFLLQFYLKFCEHIT
ncbi:hypothetical protein LUZ63_009875 [Rhynchospora breviuscula]|uniref:Uncharacterized protein n=1 Tax=Rhynchospora breviuscula TaxID=2022672 RepID=A0A9Q0HP27_9POAL|nr:hypothetical protein LUZ63_009875 [Rhynchospora breviuscula]